MQIRDAKIEDLEQIVNIHIDNFNKNELSIILGRVFVKKFYKECIEDKNVSLLILEDNNIVKALSTTFFDYEEFEIRYKKAILKDFFKVVCLNVLNIKKLYIIARTILGKGKLKERLPNKNIYKFYMGSVVIDKKYQNDLAVVVGFHKAYKENIEKMKNHSKIFWGSLRISNQAAIKLTKMYGLNIYGEEKQYPENIYILIHNSELN
ncbi:hypothetical protein OZY48_06285 [Aliarcobacter cryaerophilus]|uniref:hypothetical protein n=1 Tax=Aliarcobacter cryaerophilus TaxID=28198 RepID=UPI003BB0BA99